MNEITKGERFVLTEAAEYVTNSIVSTSLLNKLTGIVSILSIETGKSVDERTFPFDTFLLIIDGGLEVIIEKKSFMLELGQAIIIPAHSRYSLVAIVRCKVLSTVIKSGYEEMT